MLFAIPSRINFRIRERIANNDYTVFMMFAKTQTLKGKTSLIPDSNGKHILMWDLENCTQEQGDETLRKVQISYNLSNIYKFSDIERSYRAWCFNQVNLKTLLMILLDTDYVDPLFFYHTVKRRKASLRNPNCNKKDRPKQELVSVLKSYWLSPPKKFEEVIYDTGVMKRGVSILLGEDGKILLGKK